MSESLALLDAGIGARLGERWIAARSRLSRYGESEAHHGGHVPQRAAQPVSAEEVQAIVRAVADAGSVIVPYGAGTSLEGNAEAVRGGVALDLSLMDRIVEVDAENMLVQVEPGVTREQLNAHLRDTGLFFPIDPGANATLGGMIATRASGTNAVRYGTMRDNTLTLDVVLADGTLIRTGTRARKSSAGYDLTRLFVGSEGTLGIVVGAALRLYGQPECVQSGIWPFATLDGAVQTVIATIQLGVPIARIELLDPAAIRACNAFDRLDLAECPTLFVEFHGSPASVAEQIETVRTIGDGFGGGVMAVSADQDQRRTLWRARHAALPAARAMVPGATVWVTDVCVPISHLAHAILAAAGACLREGLVAPILGHVGDGNFHIFFVLPPGDDVALAAAGRVNDLVIDHALVVGGTCTGEHGIGIGKREALIREHGDPAIAAMRSLKQALDPAGLLNPGKLFLD